MYIFLIKEVGIGEIVSLYIYLILSLILTCLIETYKKKEKKFQFFLELKNKERFEN